jgi:hypothetical protein
MGTRLGEASSAPGRISAKGRSLPLGHGPANGRNRRNLAVAVPFGEGPFTTRLQTFAIVR